jgi:transcriptional regulator with XRE-family HTH domain
MTNAVDIHVGARVRMTREFRGVSPHVMASALGVTVPSLDRYEAGLERFAMPQLCTAAQLLSVNPAFFFQALRGFGAAEAAAGPYWIEATRKGANDNC